jgi:DNA polymerase family A
MKMAETLQDIGITTLVFLDFETFWSQEYTLSKMSVRDYVTDPQFQVIGAGFARGSRPAQFLHKRDELEMWMAAIPWDTTAVCCFNARFDVSVLKQAYGKTPAFILDPLSMARAEVKPFTGSVSLDKVHKYFAELYPDEPMAKSPGKGNTTLAARGLRYEAMSAAFLKEYGHYCCTDIDLMRWVFEKMMPRFDLNELKLIDRTIRAYTEPALRLNGLKLRDHLMNVRVKKASLIMDTGATKAELMSNDKFAVALQALGVSPPRKISKTTGKTTWAFSKGDFAFLDLADHPDERVQALVAARLGTKSTLEETRTVRFIDIADKHRTLAVPLAYCSAHTTRFGGDENLNVQNLTRKSPIRDTMEAPNGHMLVVGDAKQIEARVIADLAGQRDVVEQFRLGNDVYSFAGAKIYGYPVNKDDNPTERFTGKVAQLSLGFASGPGAFQAMCRAQGHIVGDEEAKHIVKTWRGANQNIVALWADLVEQMEFIFIGGSDKTKVFRERFLIGKDMARDAGYIEFYNGLRIWYPKPRYYVAEGQRRAQMHYKHVIGRTIIDKAISPNLATNNAVQGLARTITMGHAIMLSDYPSLPLKMTVHDELVFVVKERLAQRAAEAVRMAMQQPPKWWPTLALDADVALGRTYGEAK